jgi:N utilization substance protein A
MFELEVPEIADGIISVRGISRVPGWRCKIMVESSDPRVHAVGSCVGMKGIRIQAIVRELRTEKIDIVEYNSDKKRLVKDALVPTKPVNIEYGEESDTLQVIFTDSDFSKIRRNIEDESARGVEAGDLPENESEFAKDINIRLVEQLAVIDIIPTSESRFIAAKLQDSELPLIEVDELTDQQVTRLTEAGYETAEEVLDDQLENIVRKSDLQEDEVTEIKHMLGGYFQDTKIQDVLELPVEIRDTFIENGYEFVDDVMDADQRQLLEKTGLDEEQISEAVNIMTSYSEDEPVDEKSSTKAGDPVEVEEGATASADEELPETDSDDTESTEETETESGDPEEVVDGASAPADAESPEADSDDTAVTEETDELKQDK